MAHQHPSPPLPNLHALSISPAPYGVQSDYPYNGVFGPPVATPPGAPARGWTSSPKHRGGRHGIPPAWFEPQPRDVSFNGHYDGNFRRDHSPPALSPPSSTASAATQGQPYYPAFAMDPFPSMGLAPSPPPNYGLGNPGSAAAAAYGGGMGHYGSSQLASMAPPRPQAWRGAPSMPTPDEDVIPTAIVIKNIPFAVGRETLLGIIESLGAPLPYAFNYHHDNGVFRGLAFANFRAPDEAASVVAALNGYDVQGRKLRVEYKKVLQPGEKDRIEREKAIKRMKSMQMDTVKVSAAEMGPPPVPSRQPQQHYQNGHHPQISFDSADDHSPTRSNGSGPSDPSSLDLNDHDTLRIYNMVYIFKEDRMRDELILSRNLSAKERRVVHMVAAKLALSSVTRGDGEAKHVVVTKDPPPAGSQQQAQATTTSFLAPYDGPQPGLRIKKSMPDLRGFNGPVVARDPARSLTPQRSSGNLRAEAAGGLVAGRDYASMGASHGRRLNGHGHGSGTFNTFFGTVIGAPPVPPMPSNLDRTLERLDRERAAERDAPSSSESSSSHSSQPLRNPRGPVGESRGFSSGMGMRPMSSSLRGVPGALALGRRVSEEDEHDHSRTREELDL